ncbi:hypothetical protein TDB9533_00992 [Thalassocella blandensis]|nr:hypothetical protein TDB9533_00992 [Thalassocella blandensis]
MERMTISKAIEILDELVQALTDAYWDANEVYHKDTLFDAVTTAHYERSELSKLGIDDISMRYEPVTAQFLSCHAKFKRLQSHTDDWFPRTQTAENLHNALANVLNLLNNKTM